MGYTTDFNGEFTLNTPLKDNIREYLKEFSYSRRMKNDAKGLGVEGEFFVDGYEPMEKLKGNVLNNNAPASTQPGLWCQWIPSEDGDEIEWDGGEKFYNYVEWLQYLIVKVLEPNGYVLNGEVNWSGEESDDRGTISVVDNVITTKMGLEVDIIEPSKDLLSTDVIIFNEVGFVVMPRVKIQSKEKDFKSLKKKAIQQNIKDLELEVKLTMNKIKEMEKELESL